MDRGSWGVELFLALCTLKLARPDSVYLLRGNHETGICTGVYGFLNELKAKYKKAKNAVMEVPTRQLYTTFKGAGLCHFVAASICIPGQALQHC